MGSAVAVVGFVSIRLALVDWFICLPKDVSLAAARLRLINYMWPAQICSPQPHYTITKTFERASLAATHNNCTQNVRRMVLNMIQHIQCFLCLAS